MTALDDKFLSDIRGIKNCGNCYHHRSGHCGLYSSTCATAISNHQPGPRWQNYEDVIKEKQNALSSK
ncbi:MAG: hypothetical protein M0R06_00305 [Sphaerochaeta sp.]|jgi:hypothetical protein|nr:hypothetical protein [Sphaerochaeta sp.]